MEHSYAAVHDPELSVGVQVGDDARDYPGDVQDVQDRDGDEGGSQETPEVSGLPVLDDDHQEEQVEEDGQN